MVSSVFEKARAHARWRKDTHVVRAPLSPSSTARTHQTMMHLQQDALKTTGVSYEGSWISSAHDALRRAGLEVKSQTNGSKALEPQSGLRMRKGRKARRILNRRFTRHMGRRSALMMAPLETHLDARRVQHTLMHTPYVRDTHVGSSESEVSSVSASPYWSIQMPWSHDIMWRPRPLTRGGGWWWSHLRTQSLTDTQSHGSEAWIPMAYRMRPTPTGQVRMQMGYGQLAWSRMVKMARKGFPVMGRLLNRVRRGYSIGVYGRAGFLPFKTVSPFMMDRHLQAPLQGLEGSGAHQMSTLGWGQGQRLYSILNLNHPRKTPTLSAVEPYVKIRTQWAPLSQRLHTQNPTRSEAVGMQGEIIGRTLKEWIGSQTTSSSSSSLEVPSFKVSSQGSEEGRMSSDSVKKGMWVLTSSGERVCVHALGEGQWSVQWVEAQYAWSQRARQAGLPVGTIQTLRSCPLLKSKQGQDTVLDVRALSSDESKAWTTACQKDGGLEREACAYRLKEQGWGQQLARTGGGFLSSSSASSFKGDETRLEAPSVLAQELRTYLTSSDEETSDVSFKGVRSVGGFNPRTAHDVPALMWTRGPHPLMSILEGGLGVKRVRRRGLTPSTSRARFVALQHLLRGWTVSSLVETGAVSSGSSMVSVGSEMSQGKEGTMVLPSFVGISQRGRYVMMHDDRMLGALRSVAHYSDKVRRELRARSYFESGVRTCPTLQREMWMRALTTRERRTIQSVKRVLGYGPGRRFETPSQVLSTTAPVRGLDQQGSGVKVTSSYPLSSEGGTSR